MPNNSVPFPNNMAFREGGEVSAEQLNRIVTALSRRIVGDNKTIRVRVFPGNQIVIEGIGAKAVGGAAIIPEIPRVGALPAIPESGKGEVYWDSTLSPNTGDNQLWECYAGETKWTPCQRSTNKSGTPT